MSLLLSLILGLVSPNASAPAAPDVKTRVDAVFREVTPIYIERPLGAGEAVEILHADTNPYEATIGLRVTEEQEREGLDISLHGEQVE